MRDWLIRRRGYEYLAAPLVALLALCAAFAGRGIYPFGNLSVAIWDMDIQYVGRYKVNKKLGIDVASTAQSVINGYGSHGENLYEVIQTTQAYVGIQSPSSLAHRFCHEDTFGSLVGFATLAKELGVPTPGMDAIITCISMATGIDYFTVGRTAQKVGLTGKSVEEIYEMIR